MDAPQRWDAIGWRLQAWLVDLLQRDGEKHAIAAAENTWESMTLFLFPDEQASREEVDQLVRDAVRLGRLPPTISPRARYYLGYRIQCALDFEGMLFPPLSKGSPFGELRRAWSDGQLIEWLLIDLWARRHDHWLKLNAIGVLGPFAFYGVGPTDPSQPR
ncbi:MAG: hypothetical protein PHE83_05765 [Opitutaceae bacterium]|nr:hypothetical protein [Opitutaceae bacterium]